MSGIYWLASYPKSGNTWMRVFLTNYWHGGDQPVDINALEDTRPVSLRSFFDDQISLNSGLLTWDEIDALRPAVYRKIGATLEGDQRFFKVHEAFQRVPGGEPMFPADVTLGVIYILRTPLDVAVSYAHHNGSSIDQSIEWMGQEEHGLLMSTTTLTNQLHQRLFSWSHHVRSWVDESPLPVHVVRYEDMVERPVETFTDVIRFIGAEEDAERIARAIRFASFGELKKQEQERGFHEKAQYAETFFRKGQAGSWREELSEAQAARIVRDHGAVMRRFGYLSEDGRIIY